MQAAQEGAATSNQREARILNQLDVPIDIIIKASEITALEAQQLFDLAELPIVEHVEPDKIDHDERELKIKRDNYNHDQYILELGRQEGLAKAEIAIAKAEEEIARAEEEIAKAEEEKKEMARNTALKLKAQQISVEIIADATGLSIEEIKAL